MPAYLYAQCENTTRTYANFQGAYLDGFSVLGGNLYGNITNASNAVNGQVKDASTLSVPIGVLGLTGSATQFLEFTTDGTNAGKRKIPANTTVTVKLALPKELLGLLSNFEIGSFTDLHAVSANKPLAGYGYDSGYDATKNPIYTSANIAGVIGGAGEMEITVTPTQDFNGIYIKIVGAVVSTALSMKVFHAYILELNTGSINCDDAIDVLSGVKPTSLGGVTNLTGSVTNPLSAIDADPNSFALIDVGTSILNQVYLTAVFSKPSQPADSVSIILENPGGGLLDLSLLTGFSIQPYLNGVKAGSAFANTSTFLNLKLLPGSTSKYNLKFSVANVYDRLEITMGGLTGAFSRLRIYDIKRKLVKPRTLADPTSTEEKMVCQGQTATFVIQNAQDCTEYKWYDADTGGNLVHTGLTFTPPNTLAPGNYNYYVQASRTYCATAVSERLRVKLQVNPLPVLTISNVIICSGSSAVLSITEPDAGCTYHWYSSSSGTTPLNTGTTYTTPTLTTSTIYYVEAVNTVTGCKNVGGAKPVEVTVKQYAPVPAISGVTVMCAGTNTTFTNVYPNGTWSTGDAGVATIDATGKVNAMAAGNTVISYTVAEDAIYCAKKVDFSLAVNSQPNLTLGPDISICEGVTTTKVMYYNAVSNPVSYSISWVGNLLPAVLNQVLPANEININIPSTTPVAVYHGVLTIKNPDGCERAVPFSLRVKLVPHKPTVSIN
ncbi:immunoglobulin domain-containing protein [Pedobacter terrae]|uniref:immunoglobulin domain-containing protein n=1 Tax=Pedobacter terrae TaxID=405671 RepID=UPI002FF93646